MRSSTALIALLCLFSSIHPASAQHGDHRHPPADTTQSHAGHDGHAGHGAMMPERPAAPALLPGLPMTRSASGTGWLPDASPMHAWHADRGAWNVMVHGSTFLRYTAQDVFDDGARGGRELSAPNWIMAMAGRQAGARGLLNLRAMLSLDRAVGGGAGYPLLFQTGETWEGKALVDRQHPHDFLSELSVSYGYEVGPEFGVFAYFGLPGEPALGPVAFMHRPASWHNPDAPLGHHWQDATHVTFGVATLGVRYGIWKLDGSLFTGREPDENRWDIDRPRFDSYSLRLAANPNDRVSVQASSGYIHSPEVLEPEVNVWRSTASLLYHRPLGPAAYWSGTLLWGLNAPAGHHDGEGAHADPQHSLLAEADLQLRAQAFYGRAEWVQKSAHELGVHLHDEDTQPVAALTLGTSRRLASARGLDLALGGQGTVYGVPEPLRAVYGSRPVSAQIYLQLSPSLAHRSHGSHH